MCLCLKTVGGITFQHPFVYRHTRVYTRMDINIRFIISPVCFNCVGVGGGGGGGGSSSSSS